MNPGYEFFSFLYNLDSIIFFLWKKLCSTMESLLQNIKLKLGQENFLTLERIKYAFNFNWKECLYLSSSRDQYGAKFAGWDYPMDTGR